MHISNLQCKVKPWRSARRFSPSTSASGLHVTSHTSRQRRHYYYYHLNQVILIDEFVVACPHHVFSAQLLLPILKEYPIDLFHGRAFERVTVGRAKVWMKWMTAEFRLSALVSGFCYFCTSATLTLFLLFKISAAKKNAYRVFPTFPESKYRAICPPL